MKTTYTVVLEERRELRALVRDLSDALEWALSEIGEHNNEYHHVTMQAAIEKARAALAKARGEQNV